MGRRVVDTLKTLATNESAATAIEYALMLAGIALVIVAAVATFGIAVRGLFESVPAL